MWPGCWRRTANFAVCLAPFALTKDGEFTSRALDRCAYGCGADLKLIAAGKPTEDAYIESFNGKFRDECPIDHYFNNLAHTRAVIDE